MEKFTQKQLRSFINLGGAVDITAVPDDWKFNEYVTCIGYSAGVYGCNGKMFKGWETGKLYIIVGRVSNLFRF